VLELQHCNPAAMPLIITTSLCSLANPIFPILQPL
jgi:hypothetical protein